MICAWLSERERILHLPGALDIDADPASRCHCEHDLVRGNTNAPTIMIAEKASDLVRGRVSTPGGEVSAPKPESPAAGVEPRRRATAAP